MIIKRVGLVEYFNVTAKQVLKTLCLPLAVRDESLALTQADACQGSIKGQAFVWQDVVYQKNNRDSLLAQLICQKRKSRSPEGGPIWQDNQIWTAGDYF